MTLLAQQTTTEAADALEATETGASETATLERDLTFDEDCWPRDHR